MLKYCNIELVYKLIKDIDRDTKFIYRFFSFLKSKSKVFLAFKFNIFSIDIKLKLFIFLIYFFIIILVILLLYDSKRSSIKILLFVIISKYLSINNIFRFKSFIIVSILVVNKNAINSLIISIKAILTTIAKSIFYCRLTILLVVSFLITS